MVAMPEMAAQLPATVGNVKYGLRSSLATTFAVSMALPPPTANTMSASMTAWSRLSFVMFS